MICNELWLLVCFVAALAACAMWRDVKKAMKETADERKKFAKIRRELAEKEDDLK